jgi:hypothetical protein
MNFHIDEEVCACFINWEKKFDHLIWTKIMQILKKLVLKGTKDLAANCTWIRVLNNMIKKRQRHVKNGMGVKTRMLFVTSSTQLIHQVP